MRKWIFISAVCFLVYLTWYFFVRREDLKVTFKFRTYPGIVNQTIKIWHKGLKNASQLKQTSLNSIQQQLKIDGKLYIYNWKFYMVSDSVSIVNVRVNEPGKSLINRMLIPFTETEIETSAEEMLNGFHDKISEHLNNFKVRLVGGPVRIDSTYCVYISLSTDQVGKAGGMMRNYSLLTSFLIENDIQTNGVPFVEVTDWDLDTDQLKYNFCYPILKSDSLPGHELLKYKWLNEIEAIKALYNGNYITSDRAWYALLHYAEKNQIETINRPIEFFHSNPNVDFDEKSWLAEVFLPIK